MKLQIQGFTFNPFQENTYVVYNEKREAVIIDPGCYSRQEQQLLKDFIAEKELTPLALLNTHCHIDHVLGNAFVLRTYDVKLYAHELDLPTLGMVSYSANLYGIEGYEDSPKPDQFITDNEVLTFGSIELEVIFGPGHAPGHVAFYNRENEVLIGGDHIVSRKFWPLRPSGRRPRNAEENHQGAHFHLAGEYRGSFRTWSSNVDRN